MRLANFQAADGPCPGVVLDDEIVDLSPLFQGRPPDLPSLLALGQELNERLDETRLSRLPHIPLNQARLCSPITRPDKIFGVGMNYRSFVREAEEIGMIVPAHRVWFQRPAGCVIGPNDPIWLPAAAKDLDYEAELAVIIGTRCRTVDVRDAPSVIGGYAVANDMTLRQSAASSLVLGKSCDTHTPLGPWIVTADEIPDPHDLFLRTWVNGELRQDGNSADMIASVYELVSEISHACILNPGDLILTGTPSGCGFFRDPPACLSVGDRVRIEIEGIGAIENEVSEEPAIKEVRVGTPSGFGA